jgi:hypothetical protein
VEVDSSLHPGDFPKNSYDKGLMMNFSDVFFPGSDFYFEASVAIAKESTVLTCPKNLVKSNASNTQEGKKNRIRKRIIN